jgi:N-acetylneuraminic acid mutarotase
VRRADVSAVAAGDKIFFAGGRLGEGGNDQHFSTVDIYDVSTNKWSVTNLSQSRAYIASATVGDKVFFAGGEREWPHPVSDRIDIYDLGTNTWSTASLSAPRSGLTAVTANNRIYFAGGSNQLGGTDNVESIVDIYDNASSAWSTTNLREAKTFFAGISVRGKIYWAGGYNRSGDPSCNVEIRDLATQASATAFLSQPVTFVNVEGQNALVKDDKIIWFATLDPMTGNSMDRFNIYDLTTNSWLIGLLPARISGASVISVNNIIYVAGGSVNGKMTDQVWKLEF